MRRFGGRKVFSLRIVQMWTSQPGRVSPLDQSGRLGQRRASLAMTSSLYGPIASAYAAIEFQPRGAAQVGVRALVAGDREVGRRPLGHIS